MPLLVSLARDTDKHDLGFHQELVILFDELQRPDGTVLARFRHNRWLREDSNEPYARLDIVGPLTVSSFAKEPRVLGPYAHFSTFDGIGHVDRRVFAVADVQQRDWYVHDAGEHWKRLKLLFQATGP